MRINIERQNDMSAKMLDKVRVKTTGFTGIVTGYCVYANGSEQQLVTPSCAEDGSHRKGVWFYSAELEVSEIDAVPIASD